MFCHTFTECIFTFTDFVLRPPGKTVGSELAAPHAVVSRSHESADRLRWSKPCTRVTAG